MRNTFATIELIDPFLDRGQKLNSFSDFIERSFVGQLVDNIENEFFLRHATNMKGRSGQSKLK